MSEARDTEPPTQTETDIPPAPEAPGPDPNSWRDVQLQAIVDGMTELRSARAAFDPEALLARAAERFAGLTDANYRMVLTELRALASRLSASETNIVDIRRELAELRVKMRELEQRLNDCPEAQSHDAAQQAPSPTG